MASSKDLEELQQMINEVMISYKTDSEKLLQDHYKVKPSAVNYEAFSETDCAQKLATVYEEQFARECFRKPEMVYEHKWPTNSDETFKTWAKHKQWMHFDEKAEMDGTMNHALMPAKSTEMMNDIIVRENLEKNIDIELKPKLRTRERNANVLKKVAEIECNLIKAQEIIKKTLEEHKNKFQNYKQEQIKEDSVWKQPEPQYYVVKKEEKQKMVEEEQINESDVEDFLINRRADNITNMISIKDENSKPEPNVIDVLDEWKKCALENDTGNAEPLQMRIIKPKKEIENMHIMEKNKLIQGIINEPLEISGLSAKISELKANAAKQNPAKNENAIKKQAKIESSVKNAINMEYESTNKEFSCDEKLTMQLPIETILPEHTGKNINDKENAITKPKDGSKKPALNNYDTNTHVTTEPAATTYIMSQEAQNFFTKFGVSLKAAEINGSLKYHKFNKRIAKRGQICLKCKRNISCEIVSLHCQKCGIYCHEECGMTLQNLCQPQKRQNVWQKGLQSVQNINKNIAAMQKI